MLTEPYNYLSMILVFSRQVLRNVFIDIPIIYM